MPLSIDGLTRLEAYTNLHTNVLKRIQDAIVLQLELGDKINEYNTLTACLARIDKMVTENEEYSVISWDFSPYSFTFQNMRLAGPKLLLHGGIIYSENSGWSTHT
jgi:hypothetical protein